MPVRLLLFGRLEPDRSVFDPDGLRKAENALPIHGSYRPLPKLVSLGSVSTSAEEYDAPIVAAYAHIYQQTSPIQRVKPDERTGTTNWLMDLRDAVEDDAEETQQQAEAKLVGTDGFDDGSYIVSPGAPTTELWEATVNVIQAPPASAHYLFLRYKVFNAGGGDSWTVKLRVKGNAGTIATITETGSGAQDWTTVVHTLSAGEMGSFVAGDYTTEDQMTLEVEASCDGSNQTVDPDEDVAAGLWTDENADVPADVNFYDVVTDADDATYIESGALVPASGEDVVRLGLANATEPASFSNLAVIIKWSSRNNGIRTNLRLYSSGLLLAQAEDIDPPTSLTSQTKALTVEDNFPFEDVDWTDLALEIAPYYAVDWGTLNYGVFLPASDIAVGDWTTAPLFSKINDTNDATFARSPSMVVNVDEAFTVDLDTTPDVTVDTTREQSVVVRARNNDGTNAHTLKLEIIENGAVVLSQTATAAAGGAWKNHVFHISQIRYADTVVSSSGWTAGGATIVADLSLWTSESTSAGNQGDTFTIKWSDKFTDPEQVEGWLVRFTGYVASGGTSCDLNVSLYEGTTLLWSKTNAITLDTTENTYIVGIDSTAIENISDFSDLRVAVTVADAGPVVKATHLTLESPSPYPEVTDYEGMRLRITAVGDSKAGWTMDVAEAYLRLAAARTIYVSEVDLQTDPINYVGVSWAQMQVPEPSSSSYVGNRDQHAIVAARGKRIYQVEPHRTGAAAVFTDRSKGGTDYSVSPYPWSFCSWGDLILATNYVDAVQKFDADADSAFSDLITSTDKPKGRFIIAVRNQIALANVSYGGATAGEAFEWWTSDQDDAATFDDSDSTNGSKRFFLRQTPGEITAAMGGEFGLFWKRTSLIRASWIGSPLWWRNDVVSHEVGTTQPDSIVRVGSRIFFWGSDGGFYETSGHEEPRRIDRGLVRFLTEPLAQVNRVTRIASRTPLELERRMFGAYDRGSKCIVWWYRGAGDGFGRCRRGVIYNLLEDRFSTFSTGGANTRGGCELVQLPNVEHDANFLMYGLGAFEYDKAAGLLHYSQFYSRNHYTAKFLTPVYPVNPEQDTVGYINQIRPVIIRGDGRFTGPRQDFSGTRVWPPRPTPIPTKSLSVELRMWEGRAVYEEGKSVTLDAKTANPDGWIECAMKGRFVQAELTITELLSSRPIYETLGIQIKVEEAER